MPLPANIICASITVCEKLLQEKDDVLTAVRVADLFIVTTTESRPLEAQVLAIHALFSAKLTDKDGTIHEIRFEITKPNGEPSPLPSRKFVVASTGELPNEVPRGFAIALELGVSASPAGTYYILAYINEVEVCRAPFTILERKV